MQPATAEADKSQQSSICSEQAHSAAQTDTERRRSGARRQFSKREFCHRNASRDTGCMHVNGNGAKTDLRGTQSSAAKALTRLSSPSSSVC